MMRFLIVLIVLVSVGFVKNTLICLGGMGMGVVEPLGCLASVILYLSMEMLPGTNDYKTLEQALKLVDCPVCKGRGEVKGQKASDVIWSPWGEVLGIYWHDCEACNGKGKVTI